MHVSLRAALAHREFSDDPIAEFAMTKHGLGAGQVSADLDNVFDRPLAQFANSDCGSV
jgi:hypothetical protein